MAPLISTVTELVRARAAQTLGGAARYAVKAAVPNGFTPSQTIDDPPSRILARQQNPQSVQTVPVQTVPGGYSVTGPDPGTVVGITLGSVAGFLLVLWIIYTCINLGNPAIAETTSSYGGTASVVTRKTRGHSRHRHSSRHHSHRRGSRIEVRTTSTSRPARVVPVVVDEPSELGPRGRPHVERVVLESTTSRRLSGSRPPPPPSGGPTYGVPVPGPRIVHSDDESSEDEVVVIEERSRSPPQRRHRSRRGSSAYEERRYSESRRR
ncbi:hypothetical protein MCOR25_000693 [Pyricularia grisea]|uniref:Transmembrane protein n=1 Tax=Pyricularia grisea TaxID=148305 RepID=A0A6P8B839_PYRGI|nr:uncharacterized protein PgNI_04017 [Pyricularia grisea]KAI6382397.1 hypothetical protein MCOR25_000693 [Pyricularia grisea]TLD12015.1 hypothetical protein PgNI_04017 [Pyricularia grisea]